MAIVLAPLAALLATAAAMPDGLYRPTSGGAYLPPHARGGRLAVARPELLPPTDFGAPRVISDSHFAVQLNRFIPGLRSYSVAFVLK